MIYFQLNRLCKGINIWGDTMFQSLRSKLLITYTLSFFMIIFILSGSMYISQRADMVHIIQQNSVNLAEQYSEVISLTLKAHITQLKVISNAPEARKLNFEYIFNRYEGIIETDGLLFFTGGILTPDGVMHDLSGSTNNVSDRQYFVDIFTNRADTVISDAIIGKFRNIPVFVIAVPILENGEPIAALVTPLRLNEVSASLEDIKITRNSFGWIIDQHGQLIAHPNPNYIMQINIYDGDENGFIGLSDVGVQMETQASGIGKYFDDNANIEKVLSYVTIPGTPNWRLGISIPTSEIYEPLDQLFATIIVSGLAAFILAIILATIISKSIIKPIDSLTTAVGHMRTGHLDIIPLSSSGMEINKLITAFNSMSSDLDELSHSFEDRVGQRTKNLRDMNQYLTEIANRDHLTQLYNRTYLMDYLNELKLSVDQETLHNFAILFVDLNNFKYYNDTFGHDVGDKLLILCAQKLRERFRDSDIVSRYGGDEFIIVIEGITTSNLEALALELKQLPFNNKNFLENVSTLISYSTVPNNKRLSFAIGLATYEKSSELSVDQLIQNADQNMYIHKAEVKNCLDNDRR